MDLRTGTPFWLARGGLPHSYPPLSEDIETDVLIVGAGVTGAVVAHELTQAGAGVVVLDRRDVGTGSSAASTGLLLYQTDTSLAELATRIGEPGAVRVYQLGRDAIDYLERFCGGADRACDFQRRPSWYLASRRRDVDDLRAEYVLSLKHGFPVDWLDAAEIRRRASIEAPAAICATGTAEVDCYQLTHALLHAARERSARIYDRTTVTGVTKRQDRFEVTTDRSARVRARHVVMATGYEGANLAPDARLASTWVVVSEPVPALTGWPDQAVIWETARPYVYLRTTQDHRVMIGGEDESCSECHRSPYWFRRKTDRLIKRARGLFPSLDLEIAYAWAGTFSTSDDGLPTIGQSADEERLWVAFGYGGNGITFSVIAARLLRDAISGHSNADANLFARPRQGAGSVV